MALRESIVENLAGDLEYNPRRGALYLGLAAGSLCFWINSPAEIRFTAIPLIFALGGVPLLVKGIFLSRKSSDGIGLTYKEVANLPLLSGGKGMPSIRNLAAQILQDFGAGPFLLWPFLNVGKEIDSSWNDPPRLAVFAAGALTFFAGWLTRRLIASPQS